MDEQLLTCLTVCGRGAPGKHDVVANRERLSTKALSERIRLRTRVKTNPAEVGEEECFEFFPILLLQGLSLG